MSWIYHDSALEGVVYTFEELRAALNPQPAPITDSSLQPTYDDIRRHKEAIEYVRDFAIKKRLPVTVDVIKKVYLILHPEEGDIKTVKYRKDIPQHRLYFHEYAPPDKIAYKVRQVVDWLNDPETRKTRNAIRIAARAHYDMLRVYPFPTDSGKVSRLFMNLLLMRAGLPPSIIHSTERQRYYEALKGSASTVLQMVQESVENALSSVEKLLNEHETRKRAFVS
jgi:Fic family protein